MKDLACRFAKVHETAKQFSRKNVEDFAGKKIFASSSLKFIYNIVKNKINDLKDCIVFIIEDCYYYSYKNILEKKQEFKKLLLNSFDENPKEELLQYIRNNEDDLKINIQLYVNH